MKKKPKPAAAPMSVRRSLVFSFARKYTTVALTVPTIMIVSRLLTPAQVGVYSVAMAAITLLQALKDFGVSDYLVQVPKLDPALARSAFTVNLLISAALGSIIFAASWGIADFYDKPGLRLVVQILSINFFLLPFSSTVHALLKRSMQFGIAYKINLVYQTTQSGMTILLAYLGWGYLGLAWASVIATVMMIIASVTFGSAYRIRGLGLSQWREIANFGIQRTTASFVSSISNSTPDFVIGRVLDFAAVGLFSRGKGLIRMFRENVLGAIGPVTYPSYARMFRNNGSPHVLFLKATTFITGVSWPFLCFAALMAFPIIRIVFGEQWDSAVPILQLIASGAAFTIVIKECPDFFIAIGRVGLVTRVTVFGQTLRIPMIILAAFHGLLAVASVQFVTAAVGIGIYFPLLCKHTGLRLHDLLYALGQSLLVTLAAMLVPVIVVLVSPPSADNIWLPLLLSAAGAVAGWLIGLRETGHPIWPELQSWFVISFAQARKKIKWVS